MRTTRTLIALTTVAATLGLAACGTKGQTIATEAAPSAAAALEAVTTTEAPTTTAPPATTQAPTTTTARPATTTAPAPTTTAAPPVTVRTLPTSPPVVGTASERNAVKKAGSYLRYTSFSRTGLIDQLVYEGFSSADAEYGVDASDVDWNEQAAKKAASYLEYSSFSASGLLDQLVYEGFTQEQAEYGVSSTGL
jgi:hypothetical protein